jgi:hypothetical protein
MFFINKCLINKRILIFLLFEIEMCFNDEENYLRRKNENRKEKVLINIDIFTIPHLDAMFSGLKLTMQIGA